jgi:hypothetical protein
LAVLAALVNFTLAAAEQPKAASGNGPKAGGGEKQITNSIGMKLTLIPSGEFMMGSGESAENTAEFFNKTYGERIFSARVFEEEHPRHRVRITKAFYLGTCHVTRSQFRQFVADSGYKTDAEKGKPPGAHGWNPDNKKFEFNEKSTWQNPGFEQTDEHPVNVSWNDAVAFCKWLSKKDGAMYRLPTEPNGNTPAAPAPKRGTITVMILRHWSGLATWPSQRRSRTFGIPNTRSRPVTAACSRPRWRDFSPMPLGYDMLGNAWQATNLRCKSPLIGVVECILKTCRRIAIS